MERFRVLTFLKQQLERACSHALVLLYFNHVHIVVYTQVVNVYCTE
jgi:hypothetical protein